MHCTANDPPSGTCQCPFHFLFCPECCPSLIHRQGLNACFRLRAKPCVCTTLVVFVYPESVRYCMHIPLTHPTNRYPLLCRLRAGGGYVHLRALLFGVRFSDTIETVEHTCIVLRFYTTWTRSLRRLIELISVISPRECSPSQSLHLGHRKPPGIQDCGCPNPPCLRVRLTKGWKKRNVLD